MGCGSGPARAGDPLQSAANEATDRAWKRIGGSKMRLAALFVLTLAVAGCQSPEEQMEDQVRNLLSSRGNVQEAELAEGDDGNMIGHAVVAGANGKSSRYNCTATKAEGTRYNINCIPAIDEAALQATEAEIRTAIEQRGVEVVEMDMQRHNDDNHMRGHALVRENGIELRLDCTADRNMTTLQFSFACNPAGQGAAKGELPEKVDGDVVDGEGGK
jgi:hypothetical protein